jgi:hypothetical protein
MFVCHLIHHETASGTRALVSAPSRTLLAPAEMLVVERKRVPYFAAGSGGMQQPDRPSAGGVRRPRLRDSSLGGRRLIVPVMLRGVCRARVALLCCAPTSRLSHLQVRLTTNKARERHQQAPAFSAQITSHRQPGDRSIAPTRPLLQAPHRAGIGPTARAARRPKRNCWPVARNRRRGSRFVLTAGRRSI